MFQKVWDTEKAVDLEADVVRTDICFQVLPVPVDFLQIVAVALKHITIEFSPMARTWGK